jgi:uncharacterized protein (DUF302 family)
MSYYLNKIAKNTSFDEAIEKVTAELKKEGFGVLTEIDMQATLKMKIGVDFRKYVILGACNPQFAYKALLSEDKIGTLLPCNVIVQELDNGEVEVSAVDPITSMNVVENKEMESLAKEVETKLKRVVDNM